MYRLSSSTALIVAILLTVLGCQENNVAAPEIASTSPGAIGETRHIATPPEFDDAMNALTRAEQVERMRVIAESSRTLRETIDQAQSWEEAHRLVAAELNSPSDGPAFYREQVAALHMLQTRLLRERATPDRQEATSYYTDLLLEHESPEAPLIVLALNDLRGYWPEERIERAAERAASTADAYLAKETNCTDCSANEMLQRLGENVQGQEEGFLTEVAEATRSLRAMRAERIAE